MDQVYNMLNNNLNVNFDGRKVGDNPDDMKETHYGNGNVKGPNVEDALHGTHVAGIIAQIRGNGKGEVTKACVFGFPSARLEKFLLKE